MGDRSYFTKREGCPVCGQTGGQPLLSLPYDDKAFQDYFAAYVFQEGAFDWEALWAAGYNLMECPNCGVYYQAEAPNESFVNALYEDHIDQGKSLAKKTNMDLTDLLTYAGEIITAISLLDKKPGHIDVLEFGSGWGKWCQMANGFNCNVFGHELSPTRAEYSAANGVVMLALDEIKERRFDFINSEQVFEHLTHPMQTLALLAASLKEGGLIRINVPNCEPIKRQATDRPRLLQSAIKLMGPLEHINGFTAQSLCNMAQRAGLRLRPVPIAAQYQAICGLAPLRSLPWKLWRPIHRRFFSRGTELIFSK